MRNNIFKALFPSKEEALFKISVQRHPRLRHTFPAVSGGSHPVIAGFLSQKNRKGLEKNTKLCYVINSGQRTYRI
jgi:hypothetical protein